jgi:hypothetical protein
MDKGVDTKVPGVGGCLGMTLRCPEYPDKTLDADHEEAETPHVQ